MRGAGEGGKARVGRRVRPSLPASLAAENVRPPTTHRAREETALLASHERSGQGFSITRSIGLPSACTTSGVDDSDAYCSPIAGV